MIGFLRFLGLMNAAIWLGATAFYVVGADPAVSSRKMIELIGQNNFPYFSVAIAQIVETRFLYFYSVAAVVAVLHLGAEWLYLGKYPPRTWLSLVAGLCLLGMAQGWIIAPARREAHLQQFRRGTPEQREAAARRFRLWHGASRGINYVILVGLGVYLWRMGNPPDPMRFVSARQFHS